MIDGTVAPGFERVRDAFAQLFADGREAGASVAAFVDGEPVVDLHGGDGFGADTLVNTYSVTKPLAALPALMLVDRGRLALDAPVTRWWPEFGAHGKHEATVRHVLAHQAGVPQLSVPPPAAVLFDHDAMAARIAAEPPHWPPGTAHGEHALTYGHLVGELVRRVDGRDLGTFFRDEVAAPWRLDFHIGVGADDLGRVADLTDPDGTWQRQMLANDRWRPALDSPPGALHLDVVNSTAWRTAQIPAVNGHGTARAVARFYAGIANGGELDGVRLLGADTVAEALAPQASGPDRIVGHDMTWGLGFGIWGSEFGMGGIGGSVGIADPTRGLAYAYVTSRMGEHDRSEELERVLAACLADRDGARSTDPAR